MTDKTPLGKLIEWANGEKDRCAGVDGLDYGSDSHTFTRIIFKAECLLPEEKQAMEDAIKSEAAREYWEGQLKELLGRRKPYLLELQAENINDPSVGIFYDHKLEQLLREIDSKIPAPPNQ